MGAILKLGGFLFGIVSTVTWGQDTRTATLVGAVIDASGSAIAGAGVVVINADTAFISRSLTNTEGSYYVPFLAAGPYALRIEAAGFKNMYVEVSSCTLERPRASMYNWNWAPSPRR
jgi:hypothetical protein